MSRAQRQKEADRLGRLDRAAVVAVAVLALLTALRFSGTTTVDDLTGGRDRTRIMEIRLDPNSAPWWELTALAGVGETRAKAIVGHRSQARTQAGDADAIIYRSATDLEAVKGIGPKTVARIADHLTFPRGGRRSP